MREEIPEELADEAAERLAAFDLGLIGWPDVVSWADSWVLRLSRLPELLLEVSLNATRPQDGASALGRLADLSSAAIIPYLKTLWREKVESRELDAVGVARAAWQARTYASWESEEWVSILRMDHFYDDLTASWHPDDTSRRVAEQALNEEVNAFLGIESPD